MELHAAHCLASQVELEKLKFFAKPRLALDAVGGTSALRIADTLAEVQGLPLHCNPVTWQYVVVVPLPLPCLATKFEDSCQMCSSER